MLNRFWDADEMGPEAEVTSRRSEASEWFMVPNDPVDFYEPPLHLWPCLLRAGQEGVSTEFMPPTQWTNAAFFLPDGKALPSL